MCWVGLLCGGIVVVCGVWDIVLPFVLLRFVLSHLSLGRKGYSWVLVVVLVEVDLLTFIGGVVVLGF